MSAREEPRVGRSRPGGPERRLEAGSAPAGRVAEAAPVARVRVEMWSDVVCPWCHLGRQRLLEAARRTGIEVDLVHHAFQLDPARREAVPVRTFLAARYGPDAVAPMTERVRALAAQAGLVLDFDRAVVANTFDAHRLVQWAAAQGRGDDLMGRLMRAHFADGADVSDHATLRRLAEEVGLDAEAAGRVLAGDAFAAEVADDRRQAAAHGIGGVPFFVAGGHGVSGAQPVDVLSELLRRAAAASAGAAMASGR